MERICDCSVDQRLEQTRVFSHNAHLDDHLLMPLEKIWKESTFFLLNSLDGGLGDSRCYHSDNLARSVLCHVEPQEPSRTQQPIRCTSMSVFPDDQVLECVFECQFDLMSTFSNS
jgi:hypothetical protein